MENAFRIPLRRLFLWVSLYAILFAVVGGLPLPHVVLVTAVVVFTLFVVADMRSYESDRRAIPMRARRCIVLAYYGSAFAASGAVSLALFMLLPDPPTPPKPALPFLYLVSGQLFADLRNAIRIAMMPVIAFLTMFTLSGALAFFSSVFAIRYFRSAKWLAIFNFPAAAIFGFVLISKIYALVSWKS